MTKARDLANASTALSAVSATELAFVDGVTSAIQTQMDAKAPSSTAATLTGTQTLTNKTIDTASNTITGAVTLTGTQTLTNKTLTSPALTTPTISTLTTNGDLLYGTGSGALSRLGIGSTSQVLTVTGGVPAWATAGGSATNFALINSGGTALTGASTITVSSISGKNQLAIYIVDCSSGSGAATFILRINSDSASNYYFARFSAEATTFDLGGGNDASFPLGSQGSTAANAMSICEIKIDGCNAAGIKTFASQSRCNGTSSRSNIVRGHYTGTSTISSISLISESGNFDAGTIYVYGA